jgi:hypothetical protein
MKENNYLIVVFTQARKQQILVDAADDGDLKR